MDINIKNSIVLIQDIKKTIKNFSKELKKQYPDCIIFNLAREISNTHAEVFSFPISNCMSLEEAELINKKIFELMQKGFTRTTDSTQINVSNRSIEFEQSVSFGDFKKD